MRPVAFASILFIACSGCARSQELTKDQRLAKIAAEVLLDLEQKLLYSVNADRLNKAKPAAYASVPKWKDNCPGLSREEFRHDTARMTDRGIIDAKLIGSELELALVKLFPRFQDAKEQSAGRRHRGEG